MSRSSHLRQMQLQQQQQMADNEAAALAAEIFDHFCVATTMRQVLGLYRNMCDTVGLRPAPLNEFYPKLKAKIRSWKAQALWKKFDARAAHRVYNKGNACTGARVLVIGAGPCGLRTAIEAQLLGAKVVVVEKRDRISRNNVLHLWPFVITDLRNLGAKKFYGKFCAGSIDHISIRQLQCILLKVALLLGVEIHEGVSFLNTIEPSDGCGWRAQISPEDHAVSHYEFDVLIGADGKRNTLEGFKRKEFRGKLAIAITANFINKKTEAEAKAEEISGVAFIFNQSFFKELYATTGIDLENIVYYKDETHYFVMTAKKHSLIDKGVIIHDFADPAELLAPANVNTDKLLDYAREAAEFSTKYQMPNLEFAVNHYGKPDVAMFDFTSMFAAEASCRVFVKKNYRLLQCLVGDSLLEPFWPTGSGCARGFLSSMDAAYALKLWSNPKNSILGVLAQRESIYRLLAQTTPENLHRDIGAYTVDPATRYPNLNKSAVNVWQVKHLVNTDDKTILEQVFMDTNAMQAVTPETPVRRKRRTGDTLPLSAVLLRWIKAQLHGYEFSHSLSEVSECFTGGKVLCVLINRYRPDLIDLNSIKDCSPAESNELAFKILETELNIPRVMSAKDSINLESVDSKIWLNYLEQICEVFRGEIPHVKHPKLDFAEFKEKNTDNKAQDFSRLLKISSKKAKSPMHEVDTANVIHRRSVLDEDKLKRQRKHGGLENIPAAPTEPRRAKKRRSQEKTANIDRERGIASALPRGLDENFSDRIKSMEQRITSRGNANAEKKPKDLLRAIGKIESTDWNIREIEKKIEQSKKAEIGKSREKVPKWSKEQFLARQNKMAQPEQPEMTEEKFKEIDQTLKNFDKQLKEGSILEVGERGRNKVASIAGQFVKKDDISEEKVPSIPKSSSKVGLVFSKQAASEKCHFCRQTVYLMEKISTEGLILHRSCLKCHHCHTNLRLGAYAFDRDDPVGRFYCTQHFRLPAKALRPVVRKPSKRKSGDQAHAANEDQKTPARAKGRPENVAQLDMLDRGQTPERIEFENADAMSDGEPSLENIIDENEWTDRNFISGSDDLDSDLSSSDSSDEASDSDMFEEANGSPLGAQTLQLATDWIGKQRYSNMDDSDDEDFYDSSEGLLDDDADSQTEGEEFKKAREMRRQEVKLLPPPQYLPTDTETEVVSKADKQHISNDNISSDKISDNPSDTIANIDTLIDKLRPVGDCGNSLKTDIKTIERDTGRRISSDIDVLAENLYHLNNLIKLSKDVDNFKRESSVREDIMKKLSLKEKWLGDMDTGNLQNVKPVEEDKTHLVEKDTEKLQSINPVEDQKHDLLKITNETAQKLDHAQNTEDKVASGSSDLIVKTNIIETNSKGDLENAGNNARISTELTATTNLTDTNSKDNNDNAEDNYSKSKEFIAKTNLTEVNAKGVIENAEDNSSKSKKTNSTENCTKSVIEVSNSSKDDEIRKETHAIVSKNTEGQESTSKQVCNKKESKFKKNASVEDQKDIGKFLYNVENKFSPKEGRRMSNTLKKIEVKNFSDTMDSIKSQITSPKISKQSSLDLSKYFPNQKSEKAAPVATNKSQKTLKDVDLSRYFPQSPVQQRKGSLTSAASAKVNPSIVRQQSEASALKTKQTTDKKKTNEFDTKRTNSLDQASSPTKPNAFQLKRNLLLKQESIDSKEKEYSNNSSRRSSLNNFNDSKESELDIFDQLLDGAVDIKKSPVTSNKNKSPKIAKKTNVVKTAATKNKKKVIAKEKEVDNKSTVDVDEQIFEEILQGEPVERSSSLEYKKLFDDEKSPSTDISDKIDNILKDREIYVSSNDTTSQKKGKIIQKTNLSAEEEPKASKSETKTSKIVGNKSNEAKNINNVKKSNSPQKRPKEIKVNGEKRKSMDFMTDFEKTMDYLKSEWRSEATNFLQKKRDSFYAKRKGSHGSGEDSFDFLDEAKTFVPSKSVQDTESQIALLNDDNVDVNISTEVAIEESKIKQLNSETKNFKNNLQPSIGSDNSEAQHRKLEEKIFDIKNSECSDIEACTDEDLISNKIGVETPVNVEETTKNKNVLPEDISSTVSAEVLQKELDKDMPSSAPEKENEITTEISKSELGELETKQQKDESIEMCSIDEVYQNHQLTPAFSDSPVNEKISENETNKREKSSSEENSELLFSDVEVANVNVDEAIEELMGELETNQQKVENIIVDEVSSIHQKIQSSSYNIAHEKSLIPDNKNTERRKSSSEENSELLFSDVEVANVNVDEAIEELMGESGQQNDIGMSSLDAFVGEDQKSKSSSDSPKNKKSITPEKQNAEREKSSSEEDSIEKLFSQFTDDMLVDVEFDSNDEIISITPRMDFKKSDKIEETKLQSCDEDKSQSGKSNEISPVPSIESSTKNTSLTPDDFIKIMLKEEGKQEDNLSTEKLKMSLLTEPQVAPQDSGDHFPIKPTRRYKSISSSKSPSSSVSQSQRQTPLNLSRLDPVDMPPSVQEILRNIRNDEKVYFVEINDQTSTSKFPVEEKEPSVSNSPCLEILNSPSNLEKTKNNDKEDQQVLDEWEYIEKLEKERRAALIKRDQLYEKENKPINLITKNEHEIKQFVKEKQNSYENVRNDQLIPGEINASVRVMSRSESNISSSPPKAPPRSPKSRRKLRQEVASLSPAKSLNQMECNNDNTVLSRSSEDIPIRPKRRQNSLTSDKDRIDDGTKLLLERSKMLHNLKEEFMDDKIAGNNPYLKKIKKQDDSFGEAHIGSELSEKPPITVTSNYGAKPHSHQQFPTSKSIESRRHQRNNSDYSDTGRRTPNLVSSLGPRNFVEYFKRSPSKERRKTREPAKDACIIS